MADDLIQQIGEENSALRVQATEAILQGLAEQGTYSTEDLERVEAYAIEYGAIITSLIVTIAEVAEKKGITPPLSLISKIYIGEKFTTLNATIEVLDDGATWQESAVKAVGGYVAGAIAGTVATGALGTLTAAGSGICATGAGIAGTFAAAYFASSMVSDFIGDQWQYYVGPKVKGVWDQRDNSADFTVSGKFSDALRNKWDSMDAEADGEAINLDLNNLSRWTMQSTLTGEQMELTYLRSTNTYTFVNATTSYIVDSFRDLESSGADLGRTAMVEEILRHHQGDFNVAIENTTPHLVHNYYGFSREQLQQLLNSDEKAATWAALNLTGYVEEVWDNYEDVDTGDYSNQFLQDRAAFLFHSLHSGEVSPTSEDIDFKDLQLQEKAYAGNGEWDLPGNAKYTFGTTLGDSISGSSIVSRDDHLYGMGGNDTIKGHGGNDYIEGGQGQDTMHGGSGNDDFVVMGEDTNYDIFYGGSDYDKILGGNKSGVKDVIRLHNFDYATNSIEEIDGRAGENIIAGTDMNDTIDLSGVASVKHIDRIEGGGGSDELTGTDGGDVLYGGGKEAIEDHARDVLEGGAGNDTYYVGAGDVIDDADLTGSIIFNNQPLSSLVLKKAAPNSTTYRSNDDIYSGVFNEDTNSLEISVVVNGTVKSFTIENFTTTSALGITLMEYEPPQEEYDFNWQGTNTGDNMDVYRQNNNHDRFNIFLFSHGGTEKKYSVYDLSSSPSVKLDGLDGNDYLFGFADNDNIRGGNDNDLIMGHLATISHDGLPTYSVFPGEIVVGDELYGDAGNDGIFGSMGIDSIDGGAGDDILSGYNGDDTILGGTGRDILFGSLGDDKLEGNDENDALYGYGAHHSLGFEDLESPAWTLTYQDGYLVGCNILFSVYLNGLQNELGDDTLKGGGGDDLLAGGGGSDKLYGGADQDALSGGIGGDLLNGGDGHDLLFGDNGDNVETADDGIDYLYGGAGNDYLYGQGNNDYLYGEGDDDYLIGGGGNDTLYGGSGVDYLYGDMGDGSGSGADELHGGTGNDHLYGHGGNDKLYGGDGIDELQGNLGNDELHGGEGTDYLYGDNGIDGSGDGADALYGEGGDDYLYGHGGDDILVGGYGSDILEGGQGNNRYIFEVGESSGAVADRVVNDVNGHHNLDFHNVALADIEVAFDNENDGLLISYSATDQVYVENVMDGSNVSFTLEGIEYSYNAFLDSVVIAQRGTDGDDILNGGNRNDVLYGGGGSDELNGLDGDDVLYGEQGDDLLRGGGGNDKLIGGTGADILEGGAGDDTYISESTSGRSVISDNEGLNFIEISTDLDDVSIDYVSLDTFGNYVVDSEGPHLRIRSQVNSKEIIITDGKTVSFSYSFNNQRYSQSEILRKVNLTLYGTEDDDILHGNWGDDSLYGFGGNDSLHGNGGDDYLDGGDGNDTLHGGSGDDRLIGGQGDDFLMGGSGADVLDGGYGIDTVSYADETEDIIVKLWTAGIGGSAEGDIYEDIENIIGGKGDDYIVGSRYGSILEGGEGADILDGLWGWQSRVSYRTSAAGVMVNLTSGEAYGGDAEGDRLTGFSGIIGSEFDDSLTIYSDYYGVLYGLGGGDILRGGEDGDEIDGGLGDDFLFGEDGSDKYFFNIGYGKDVIHDSVGSNENISGKDRFGHIASSTAWIDQYAGKADRIVLGEGITADDLLFHRAPEGEGGDLGNNDLVIALRQADNLDATWDQLADKIIIKDFFNHLERPEVNIYEKFDSWSSENWKKYAGKRHIRYGDYFNFIEKLQFADGTVMDINDLVASHTTGSAGDDHLENLHGKSYGYNSVSWHGYEGNDLLIGGNGDDELYGDEGEDTLDGREGDNRLDGGTGNDTYIVSNRNVPISYDIWYSGGPWGDLEGVDTITDEEGNDKLLFDNDIAREDIIFTMNGNGDLVIDYGLAQQFQVIIRDNSVELFEMSDGSTISRERVMAALQRIANQLGVSVYEVTSGEIANSLELKSELYNSWQDQFVEYHGHDDWNEFNGNADNEIVFGGAGEDRLMGHSGDDELHGEGGDDYLNAGNGNDVYVYARDGQNDTILDKEHAFMTDSYGSFQIDDGIYEDLQTWTTLTPVKPNQAPSNDTIEFGANISRDDLEIFWATPDSSFDMLGDDLFIRVKPEDDSQGWQRRENNVAAIISYYNAMGMQETVFNAGTGEYEQVDKTLVAEDFTDYSDKALRYLAYQLLEGSDEVGNATLFEDVAAFLDNENNALDFRRMYRSSEDTLYIEGFYNRETTIENLVLSGCTLTYNDILDLMSTDNSEMIRGVDWASNTIYAQDGNDVIVAGAQNDFLYGGNGDDIIHGSLGADVIDGGIGVDTVNYGKSVEGVSVHLHAGRGYGGFARGDRLNGVENAIGSHFADVLIGDESSNNLSGNDDNDHLQGREGDDALYGGKGNDFLRGGAGADHLAGGDGRDAIDYRDSAAGVSIDLAAGTAAGGTAEGDTFSSIEKVYGSHNADVLRGDSGRNTLLGFDGNDELHGEGENDNLQGREGDDALYGGTGNDFLRGGAGADHLAGGDGLDAIDYRDSATGVSIDLAAGTAAGGTAEGDTFSSIEKVYGSHNADVLRGDSGRNTLLGFDGNDELHGEEDNDNLQGRDGDDELYGGAGNDFLRGGAGADHLAGGEGLDAIDYRDSAAGVTIDLAAGTAVGGTAAGDTFSSIEKIYGSHNADVLRGDSGRNTLLGFDGNDELHGEGENDNLQGREGDDTLYGGTGNDFLRGGAGADHLAGGEGLDVIDYRDSATGVTIDLAAGTAVGGTAEGDTFSSIEKVYGSHNADVLRGDSGRNTLLGFDGNDELHGEGENDNLQGREGDDTLFGGLGRDYLKGGAGSDTFVFNTALDGEQNVDCIADFESGKDTLSLHTSIFDALQSEGILSEANFHAGETGPATDDNDYILYNTSTGSLSYDFDGSGQGVAVEFAKLTSKPELRSNDIVAVA